MEFINEFTVPLAPDDTWTLLIDIPRIAPCLPGASVTEIDGRYEGALSMKVGPIKVAYGGVATFEELDQDKRKMTLNAQGREKSGKGAATAIVQVELLEAGSELTRVRMATQLQLTGRLAQFGRNALADVGERLIGQFSSSLERMLLGGTSTGPSDPAPSNTAQAASGSLTVGAACTAPTVLRAAGLPTASASDPWRSAATEPAVAELNAVALAVPILKRAVPALIALIVGTLLGVAMRRPRRWSGAPLAPPPYCVPPSRREASWYGLGDSGAAGQSADR